MSSSSYFRLHEEGLAPLIERAEDWKFTWEGRKVSWDKYQELQDELQDQRLKPADAALMKVFREAVSRRKET